MYKVLLLDLDGSLLKTDNTISTENKKAISVAIENGVMVSIGSGRPALDIYGFIEQLNLKNSYHVADNGLNVFKYGNKPKRFTSFDKNTYNHMLNKLFESNAIFAVLADNNDEYLVHKDSIANLSNAIEQPGANSLDVKIISKENLYKINNAYKILTYIKSNDEYKFAKNLEKECNMNASMVSKGFMNYMPAGVNKFTGAKTLSQKLGISIKQMVAIGDEENDYHIIKNIGLGVAPKNASHKIKEVADLVLDVTNDEDAVAKLIYNYILK